MILQNRQLAHVVLIAIFSITAVSAAELDLPDVPLFLQEELPPNVILTLDNSASMGSATIFDFGIECANNRFCQIDSGINRLYYNPEITYQLPKNADGTDFPPADFNNALVDGFDSGSNTIDLGSAYHPTFSYVNLADGGISHNFVSLPTNVNNARAYYTSFNRLLVDPVFGSCDINFDNNFNSPHADNCFDFFNVPESQEQNFANWYSYYRTRLLMTKSAATITFDQIDPEIRVGWNDINVLNSFSETNGNFVSPFTGGHRSNFYSWLTSMQVKAGTPLIEAMQTVGEYVSSTDNINPFATVPGAADHDPADDLSCRQNYNVLFTDGAWGPLNSVSRDPSDDFDSQSTTLPDGTSFTAGTPPYTSPDPAFGFLADWSFFYWSNDLRPDLENNLTPYFADQSGSEEERFFNSENDPATWQHLVNYTVTLGVRGVINFPDAFPFIASGQLAWPTQRDATGSAVTADSTLSASTEFFYRASFSTSDWSGTLEGFFFNDLAIGDQVFDAGCRLTGGFCENDGTDYGTPLNPVGSGGGSRRIITRNTDRQPVPFRLAELSENQRLFFGADDEQASKTLNYIRGVRELEQQRGGDFRNRSNILGDIINSSPALVHLPARAFPSRGDWEDLTSFSEVHAENSELAETFSDFETRVQGRERMVYVGANDGMLHAFNGVSGREEFAYIPSILQSRLAILTDPNYTHEFFVDGSPSVGDAFFENDRRWHSVLTGHLRTGGQMVYGIDVTTVPLNGNTESDIANKLLWEFTHPDLGYGLGSPEVARMHDGSWVAIFGNGYNNTEEDGNVGDGEASLFIVDIRSGGLIKQIQTGVGSATNPNGLGNITVVDTDGDFIVDTVYGGDLLGNLWKFDVTDTFAGPVNSNDNPNIGGWRVAYSNSSGPIPLFKAISSTGAQSITQKPNVILHPIEGVMVVFGTGQYLEENDNTNDTVVNSMYGIWDRNEEDLDNSLLRSDLSIRILSEDSLNAGGDAVVRSLSGESIDFSELDDLGWYFDFFPGELQFTNTSQFNFNLVAFTTFEPSLNECTRGGTSFLFVISTFQGTDPGFIPFDINGDNLFDADDRLENQAIASARRLEGSGVIAPLNIIAADPATFEDPTANRANILATDLDGNSIGAGIQDKTNESRGGRVQWRQIK